MSLNSPVDTLKALQKTSIKKRNETIDQTSVLGFLAGAFIALGGSLSLFIAGSIPTIKEQNPGLQKLLFGSLFPVGLILTLLTGSSLFTGNVLIMSLGVMQRRISVWSLVRVWVVSYLTNLLGALFVAYFLVFLAFDEKDSPWVDEARSIASGKMNKGPGQQFLSAITCNWLVCLAVYFNFAATSFLGKVVGIWWPIMAFVASGFEHCVANMFFLPLGLMYSAPSSPFWKLIVNIIMVTLGNIVGGSIFAGFLLWYPHQFRNDHSVSRMSSALYHWWQGKLAHSTKARSNEPSPTTTVKDEHGEHGDPDNTDEDHHSDGDVDIDHKYDDHHNTPTTTTVEMDSVQVDTFQNGENNISVSLPPK
eukprot:gb/GECH01008968.1/.p1 GENE.gb/GECH01008968.1/~~gb/GECH01008968.1/.p1  ORF type:complete len:363 (+),score=61.20 gb/GECH01008968.1/:1-1089(+)